jgi:hypothetical protein
MVVPSLGVPCWNTQQGSCDILGKRSKSYVTSIQYEDINRDFCLRDLLPGVLNTWERGDITDVGCDLCSICIL